jgi:hypothetical protein
LTQNQASRAVAATSARMLQFRNERSHSGRGEQTRSLCAPACAARPSDEIEEFPA